MQIRHTGIYVDDLERMKEFYCTHFDMEVAVHATEQGAYIDALLGCKGVSLVIYKLAAPEGGMIELLKCNQPNSHRKGEGMVWETGRMHIALTVEDVGQKQKELLQIGIPFLSAPCRSPDGNAIVCFCRDPEGNYLELVEVL